MATRSRFEINGVIDTNQNVFENIELLATSAGCFITWDPAAGQWSVIVNEAGSSVFSFTDSNIIGAITVGGSGINELYNSVELEYPHRDLRDAVDYITVSIDPADRFTNELDNQLQIKLNTINDPVQARILATQELKQNRMDKIIEFQTDFTANGLTAGELISVTNTALDFSNKVFRIIQIAEEDIDDGAIVYNITALEYSADVYSISGLAYDFRTKNNGIPSKIVNDEIAISDAKGVGDSLKGLLVANILAGLFNPNNSGLLGNILKSVLGVATDANGDPIKDDGTPILEEAERYKDKILGNVKLPALTNISAPNSVCEGDTITVTFGHNCTNCLFDLPNVVYNYTLSGVVAADVGIPLTGTVTLVGNSGSLVIPTTATAGGSSSKTLSITIGSLNDTVIIYDITNFGYTTTASSSTITEGQSSLITVNTTNVPNGTVIPYTIAGSATGKVSSPALSGNITINSNTATINIVTTDDGVVQGTQSLTFTINPGFINPCNTGTVDLSATITVLDNDVAPPADTTCLYIQVPIVWCAVYDGTDEQMKDSSVRQYAYLPVAQAGEASINLPATITVTKGNPSSISVASTVSIASSSALGGIPIQVITSFNTVAPKGLITGTTATVYGYLA